VTAELVHITRGDCVRTLTLDSPHNRNALSSQLLGELADGLEDAAADPAVRVIVLTGAGSVFCSGADLSERAGSQPSRLPEIFRTIRGAGQPVIARVNGHARAGGLGLIAVSDLAVAASDSTYAFSEVRVGVAPAMILVPALGVTDPRFLAQMTLTGERFNAAAAADGGLLTDVVGGTDELDQWVDRAVASILKSAPGAVAATKALLAELPGRAWSEALVLAQERSAALFAGAEAAEGMDAFLTKRTPSWDRTAP
jgi:methylglutaconyl-CoA hydratase